MPIASVVTGHCWTVNIYLPISTELAMKVRFSSNVFLYLPRDKNRCILQGIFCILKSVVIFLLIYLFLFENEDKQNSSLWKSSIT